ncbi:MAG: hypothetical protein ACYC8T_07330 [Myxococcaceae bacterium]
MAKVQAYRAAAVRFRAAASACPSESGCSQAQAVFYDCLASQAGIASSRCLPPSCKPAGCPPAAGSKTQSPDAPVPALPPAPQAMPALSASFSGLLQASEKVRTTREKTDLAQARQLWELEKERASNAATHVARIDQDLRALVPELQRATKSEGDAYASALAVIVGKRALGQTTNLVWPGEHLSDGPGPADKDPKCSPWFAMKDPSGFEYTELDLAVCGQGTMLASGALRDRPMWWMVRNRSKLPVSLRYQVGIQCITACRSGWYDQQATLAPGKKLSSQVRGGSWHIIGHRVLEALAGATKPGAASALSSRPESFGPASAAKVSLADRFREQVKTDALSASATASDYLAAPPWDPLVARQMLAFLSAREAQRGEIASAGPSLEDQLAQTLEGIRAAAPSTVEVHVTDQEMKSGAAAPLSNYETHVWSYQKPEVHRCNFVIGGKLTQRTVLSIGKNGELSAPDPHDVDLRASWDLTASPPDSVRIEAGSTIQAKVAQREGRGPLGGGHRKVRAVSPEYYVVSVGPESGLSPESADALVFAEESAARNVAVQLVRASVVCRELAGRAPDRQGGAPEGKVGLVAEARRVEFSPTATAGDQWEFALRGSGGASTSRRSVTEVAAGRIVTKEETTSGSGTSATVSARDDNWNVLSSVVTSEGSPTTQTYDFALVEHLFPFRPGMSWHQRVRQVQSGDAASSVEDLEIEVVGWERVTVPAGTWDALKVRKVSRPVRPGESAVTEYVTTFWYVPEVKAEVRTESPSGVSELTSFKVTPSVPDATRRKQEDERLAIERRKAEEEADQQLALEAEARKKAEAEERQQLAREAAERKRAEAEEKSRLALEAAERKKAEAEERGRLALEAAERKKAEAEEKKRLAREEADRKKAEAEAAKLMDAETRQLAARARELEAEAKRTQAARQVPGSSAQAAVVPSAGGSPRRPANTLDEAKADPRFRFGAIIEDAKVRVVGVSDRYPYFGIPENGCSAGKNFATAELLARFDGQAPGTSVVLRLENPSPGSTAPGATMAFPLLRRAGKGKDGTFVYCGKGTAFPVRR